MELDGAPLIYCLFMGILDEDFSGKVTNFHSSSELVGEGVVVGLSWGLDNGGLVENVSGIGGFIRWVHYFLL